MAADSAAILRGRAAFSGIDAKKMKTRKSGLTRPAKINIFPPQFNVIHVWNDRLIIQIEHRPAR
jgi:hypothetical protein